MMVLSLSKCWKNAFAVLLLIGLMMPAGVQAAGQIFWDWPSGRKFKEVELLGTAVNQDGFLVPGFSNQVTGPSGAEVCRLKHYCTYR